MSLGERFLNDAALKSCKSEPALPTRPPEQCEQTLQIQHNVIQSSVTRRRDPRKGWRGEFLARVRLQAALRIRRQPFTEHCTAPSDVRGAESRSRQMAPSTGHRAPLPTPGKQPSSKPPTIIGVSHHIARPLSLATGADRSGFAHRSMKSSVSLARVWNRRLELPQGDRSLLPPHQVPPRPRSTTPAPETHSRPQLPACQEEYAGTDRPSISPAAATLGTGSFGKVKRTSPSSCTLGTALGG